MKKHKTKAWTKKSLNIRRRDLYLCQECKRYGRVTEAQMVHHIFPAEIYPELFYNDNNLISLCNSCHELMHNRADGTLTAKGLYWQRKVENKIFLKNKKLEDPPC